MIINIISFGYRRKPPSNLDLIFDVRDLPNPHSEPSLRNENGKHSSVKSFMNKFRSSYMKVCDIYYVIKSKPEVVNVGIGCWGGVHRSVFVACEVAKRLKDDGYKVYLKHRDIK